MRGAGAIVALALAATPAAAAGERWSLAVFGGTMLDNPWEEALTPWRLEPRSPGLIGVAAARSWPLGRGWSVEAEVQAVRQFGLQTHWEVNAPLVLRWNAERVRWLEGLAFGAGLSWASEPPAFEVARDGASQEVLFYWTVELAFPAPGAGDEIFARLHHRSDGYGALDTDAGSNALVLGLRRRF